MKRRTIQPATVTPRDDSPVTEEETAHPAFGLISAVRTSTGGRNFLFGSDFDHSYSVTVRVHEATTHRSLSNDRHHAGKTLIEFEMTDAQFASLSSAVGTGEVPCTLRYAAPRDTKLERIPDIEAPRQRIVQFTEEMRKVADEIDCTNASAVAMVEGLKGISQRDRAALLNTLKSAGYRVRSSLPFIAEQFSEHVEREVDALKTAALAISNSNPAHLVEHQTEESGDTIEHEQPRRLPRRRS